MCAVCRDTGTVIRLLLEMTEGHGHGYVVMNIVTNGPVGCFRFCTETHTSTLFTAGIPQGGGLNPGTASSSDWHSAL